MNNSKRGAVLDGRVREIIYHVNKVFETEKVQAKELLRNLSIAKINETPDGIPIPLELFDELTEFLKATSRATERVVRTTGVNKNTVTRIKREGTEAEAAGTNKIITPVRTPRGKSVVLDKNELYALNKIIVELYTVDKTFPSLTKILAKARSNLNFQGSMGTLRRILVEELGYKYEKGPDQFRQITINTPNIIDGDNDIIVTEYLETEIGSNEDFSDTLNEKEQKKEEDSILSEIKETT